MQEQTGSDVQGGGREEGRQTLNTRSIACINEMIRSFYTHVYERGVHVVGVLLSSLHWDYHSVEFICWKEEH